MAEQHRKPSLTGEHSKDNQNVIMGDEEGIDGEIDEIEEDDRSGGIAGKTNYRELPSPTIGGKDGKDSRKNTGSEHRRHHHRHHHSSGHRSRRRRSGGQVDPDVEVPEEEGRVGGGRSKHRSENHSNVESDKNSRFPHRKDRHHNSHSRVYPDQQRSKQNVDDDYENGELTDSNEDPLAPARYPSVPKRVTKDKIEHQSPMTGIAEAGEAEDGEILEDGELSDDETVEGKDEESVGRDVVKVSSAKATSKEDGKSEKHSRKKSEHKSKRKRDPDDKARRKKHADADKMDAENNPAPAWGSGYQGPKPKSSPFHSKQAQYGRGGRGYHSPPGLYDSPSYSEDSGDESLSKTLMTEGYIDSSVAADEKEGIFNPKLNLGKRKKLPMEKNDRKRGRNFEGKSEGPPRKKLLSQAMSDRPVCKFYMEGKCAKGHACQFNHDVEKPRKNEICKYHLTVKGCIKQRCMYMHEDFPCKYYHTGAKCYSGDRCKFSHDPLTEETKRALEMRVAAEDIIDVEEFEYDYDYRPRESNSKPSLLGSPPRSRQDVKKIPSLFEIEVHPPGQSPKPSPQAANRPSGFYNEATASPKPGVTLNASDSGNNPNMGMMNNSAPTNQPGLSNQGNMGGPGLLQTPLRSANLIGGPMVNNRPNLIMGMNPQQQRPGGATPIQFLGPRQMNSNQQGGNLPPVLNMLGAIIREAAMQKGPVGANSNINMGPNSGMVPIVQNMQQGLNMMNSSNMPQGNMNMGPNNMGSKNMGPNNMGSNNMGSNNMGPNNMGSNNMGPNNMGSNNMASNNIASNNMASNNMGPNNMGPNNMGPNNMGPNNMGPNNMSANSMGPNSTGPNNMGPNNIGPNNMGSNNMGPNNMGPNNMGLNNMGPNNMGPNNMGPNNMSANSMGPKNTGPNNMGPNNIGPNNMGSNNMGSNNMGPNNMGPNNMGPNNMGPNNSGIMLQNNSNMQPGNTNNNVGPLQNMGANNMVGNVNKNSNISPNDSLNQSATMNNLIGGSQNIGIGQEVGIMDVDYRIKPDFMEIEEANKELSELDKIRQQIQAQIDKEDEEGQGEIEVKIEIKDDLCKTEEEQPIPMTCDSLQEKDDMKEDKVVVKTEVADLEQIEVPANLPKTQRELFKRIQQQQIIREKERKKQEALKVMEESEIKAEDDDWYSSDDDAEEGEKPNLTDILKKLNQPLTAPTVVTSSSTPDSFNTSSSGPPITSTFNIIQMINAIKNQTATKPSSDHAGASPSGKFSPSQSAQQKEMFLSSPTSPPQVSASVISLRLSELTVDPPVVSAQPTKPLVYSVVKILLNLPKPYTQLPDNVNTSDQACRDDPRVKWHLSYIEKLELKHPQTRDNNNDGDKSQKQTDPRLKKGPSDPRLNKPVDCPNSSKVSDPRLQRAVQSRLADPRLARQMVGNLDPRLSRQNSQNNVDSIFLSGSINNMGGGPVNTMGGVMNGQMGGSGNGMGVLMSSPGGPMNHMGGPVSNLLHNIGPVVNTEGQVNIANPMNNLKGGPGRPFLGSGGPMNNSMGVIGGPMNNSMGGPMNNTMGVIGGPMNNTMGVIGGSMNNTMGVGGPMNNTMGGPMNNTMGAIGGPISGMTGPMNQNGGPFNPLLSGANQMIRMGGPHGLGSNLVVGGSTIDSQMSNLRGPLSQQSPVGNDPGMLDPRINNPAGVRPGNQRPMIDPPGINDPRLKNRLMDPREQRIHAKDPRSALRDAHQMTATSPVGDGMSDSGMIHTNIDYRSLQNSSRVLDDFPQSPNYLQNNLPSFDNPERLKTLQKKEEWAHNSDHKIEHDESLQLPSSSSNLSSTQYSDAEKAARKFDHRNDPRFKRVKRLPGHAKNNMEYNSPLSGEDSQGDTTNSGADPGYNGGFNSRFPPSGDPRSKAVSSPTLPDTLQDFDLPNSSTEISAESELDLKVKDHFKTIDPTASPFC